MVAGIIDTPAAFIKKSISPTLSFARYNIRNATSIVATHPFQKPPYVEQFAKPDIEASSSNGSKVREADLDAPRSERLHSALTAGIRASN